MIAEQKKTTKTQNSPANGVTGCCFFSTNKLIKIQLVGIATPQENRK